MSRTIKKEKRNVGIKRNNPKLPNKLNKALRREVYLVNWSDIEEALEEDYTSYDSLLESDAEFLKLTSLNYDEIYF